MSYDRSADRITLEVVGNMATQPASNGCGGVRQFQSVSITGVAPGSTPQVTIAQG